MARRPTIADLAEAAGVSVATVDRVLNQRLPVREGTVVRVVEAAERIGYHATGLLKQRLRDAPERSLGFLLQRRDYFYQSFGAALTEATRAERAIRGRAVVEFNEEISPSIIAARLQELGQRVDAIGVVSVDHPLVNRVVEDLSAQGKPVFALLSDLTAPSRAGCLSADRRRSGRTAAWAISRLASRPGEIGMLIGSHRYLSQEIAEISFRSYMREHAPDFRLLEPIINLDDQRIAYEAVIELLSSHPDLCGIVVAGGGMDGLVRALREEGEGRDLTVVCNELTPVTREALVDGVVDLVLDTPIQEIAEETVTAMARVLLQRGSAPVQVQLPPRLYVSENV